MKKQQVDHVLRAAGRITGQKQFVIVGSQALHGKHPDLPDEICRSAEVVPDRKGHSQQDGMAQRRRGLALPPVLRVLRRSRQRIDGHAPARMAWALVNLPEGDTEGVRGLCLDPHDLAISKYYARREKDLTFTRELARRRFTTKARLLALVSIRRLRTVRRRIRADIEKDF